MIRKGRMIYVPPSVLDEAENIMQIKGLNKRADALEELTKYAKVGQEAERIYSLSFGNLFKKKGRG